MPRNRTRDKRGAPESGGQGDFYDEAEADRYTEAAGRTQVQAELTRRCLHLLHGLSKWPATSRRLLLDVGCGAGASSAVATALGHRVLGTDISLAMLARGSDCSSTVATDMAHGLPFRASTCDGAMSVSSLQWLLARESDAPLERFLLQCLACLGPVGCLVAQVFLKAPGEEERLLRAAQVGLPTGRARLLMDMPHAGRSTKLYLCLQKGPGAQPVPPTCPCAWPYQASCVLCLQHECQGAWCDGLTEDAKDEWEKRLLSEHQKHAKRMQSLLQDLWQAADGGTSDRSRRLEPAANKIAEMEPWSCVYGRRARLEAWLAGEERASQRHLGAAWEQAKAAGPRGLVVDAEAEVRAMEALPCFAGADVFILRPLKRKREPQPKPQAKKKEKKK